MMENQISQTKTAYDEAYKTLEVFVRNFATLERESLKIAKIVYKSKERVSGTTVDHWNLNGFKFVGLETSDEGTPIVSVNMYHRMKQGIPKLHVSCTKCYNVNVIDGDVAEMFGLPISSISHTTEIDGCPDCKSGYQFLARKQ